MREIELGVSSSIELIASDGDLKNYSHTHGAGSTTKHSDDEQGYLVRSFSLKSHLVMALALGLRFLFI